MNAKLLPLKGKYYGTKIMILDDRETEHVITLWDNGSYEPSDRECADHGLTIEQWRANSSVTLDGETWPAKELLEICDSHFESRETHELAEQIVRLLNNG